MNRTQNNGTYYIAPYALSFSENALGDSEKVSVSLQQGTKILVYTGTPIGFAADGSYDRWLLYAYSTAFSPAYAAQQLYIYARLTKVGRTALVIYSPNLYDIHGRILNEQGELVDDAASEDADYYYIRIGQVSAPSEGSRVLSYDSGILGTDRGERESNNDYFTLDIEGNLVFNYPIKMLEIVGSLSVGGMLMALGGLTIGRGKKFVFDGTELTALLTMSRGLEEDADMNDSQLATAGYIKEYIKKKLEALDDLYLSKVHNDTAAGKITFQSGIEVSGLASFHGTESHEGQEVHEGNMYFRGDEDHAGNVLFKTGTATFRGQEVHESTESHNGNESHRGDETHTGSETHKEVRITNKLGVNAGAIAEILGSMFLGTQVGFESGLQGAGGKFSKSGNDWEGELDKLFVRKLATIVNGVFSELVSADPTTKTGASFQSGFNGHGAKIWFDEQTGWNMELDTLTVRRIMYIFELVIQKIRSVGGILIVSAGSGKIKEVQRVLVRRSVDAGSGGAVEYEEEEYYKITFEDTNNFVRHDLMRCQRWNNGRYNMGTDDDDADLPDVDAMQYYWVEVAYPDTSAFSNSDNAETPDTLYLLDDEWQGVIDAQNQPVLAEFSSAYDILVPRSEFGAPIAYTDPVTGETSMLDAGSVPQVGDECVLMGNTKYVKRQNYIYISATEDGVPRIDVMDSCRSKSGGGNLRCRLGCLDGIDDAYWNGLEQPSGYGLYSDNAWLKGKFIVKINNQYQDLGTLFQVLDGMVRSSVSALREDLIADEGFISNNAFADGWDKWNIYAGGQFFCIDESDGSAYLIGDNTTILSDTGTSYYTRMAESNGRKYVEICGDYDHSRGIIQLNADMRNLPTFSLDEHQQIIPQTVAVSFYAMAEPVGNSTETSVRVVLGSVDTSLTIKADGKYNKVVTSFNWDGQGHFAVYTNGRAVRIFGFVVSLNLNEALINRFSTQLEQTAQSIQLIANAFDGSGNLIALTTFSLAYNEWKSQVDNALTGYSSSIRQLSDSITSSVEATRNISAKEANDYVVDPLFEHGEGGAYGYAKWLSDTEDSGNHVQAIASGNKYIINIHADSGVLRGIKPQMDYSNVDADIEHFPTYLRIGVRCLSSSAVLVVHKGNGDADGNTAETTTEIARFALTESTNYVYMRSSFLCSKENLYIGVQGASSGSPAQVYLTDFCVSANAIAFAQSARSEIKQEVGAIRSTVNGFDGRLSSVEQTADSITSTVSSTRDINATDANEYVVDPLFSDGLYHCRKYDSSKEDTSSSHVVATTDGGRSVIDIQALSGSDGITRAVLPDVATPSENATRPIVFRLTFKCNSALSEFDSAAVTPKIIIGERYHDGTTRVLYTQTLVADGTKYSTIRFKDNWTYENDASHQGFTQFFIRVEYAGVYLRDCSVSDDTIRIISNYQSSISQTATEIQAQVASLQALGGQVASNTASIQLLNNSIVSTVSSVIAADIAKEIFLTPVSPFVGGYTFEADYPERDTYLIQETTLQGKHVLMIDDDQIGLNVRLTLLSSASQLDGQQVHLRVTYHKTSGTASLYSELQDDPLFVFPNTTELTEVVIPVSLDYSRSFTIRCEGTVFYLEKITSVGTLLEVVESSTSEIRQTADSIQMRVSSLTGNKIFSNLYRSFDYYNGNGSADGDETEGYIYEESYGGLPCLCVKETVYSEYIELKFGLLPTAKEYDGETITFKFKGAFTAVSENAKVRVKSKEAANSSQSWREITQSFEYVGADGFAEDSIDLDFDYARGITLRVSGGTLHLYSIAGMPMTRNSLLSLTQNYILQYVSDNYVDSRTLINSISSYLQGHHYVTEDDVEFLTSGFVTTQSFASMFSGYIRDGQFTIASQISTYIQYELDSEGQRVEDEYGNNFIKGGVLIKADNIRLEGYTTINGNFKVDMEGNAEMNNCTIAGVLNNLIQKKVLASGEDWFLNPLRWGSIIEFTATTSHMLYLPSLYSDNDGVVHIECNAMSDNDLVEFPGMTSEDLRQCIGKKFYLFPYISNNLQYALMVKSRFLVEVQGRGVSFGTISHEVEDTDPITISPQYTRIDFTSIATSQIAIIQCCLGQFNGKECIYWEIERSATRSDTVIYVYGRLIDRSNRAVAGASISFNYNNGEDIFECQTDELGYYACRIDANKAYAVTAYKGTDLTLQGDAGQNLSAFAVGSNSVGLNLITTNNL